MTIDGRITDLAQEVYQNLKNLKIDQTKPLDQENAQKIIDSLLIDGEIDSNEADLIDEILASKNNIEVSGKKSDFSPASLSFGNGVSQEAQNTLLQIKKMGPSNSVQPREWGSVTIEDRKANIKSLQLYALEMKNSTPPISAPELWSKLTQKAIDSYQGENVSATKINDFVMQDLAIVILGPNAISRLNQYDNLVGDGVLIENQDPLVHQFQNDFALLGLPESEHPAGVISALWDRNKAINENSNWLKSWQDNGWASVGENGLEGLDKNNGHDFRPEINDQTDNQIFHTFFYQYLAYVTNDPGTINAGSVIHELAGVLLEGGGTEEDHNASMVGTAVGITLRQMRDGDKPLSDLNDWPAITGAAYGGTKTTEQNNPRALAMDQAITEMLKDDSFSIVNFLWGAENMLFPKAK